MKKGIRGHDLKVSGLENINKRCNELGIEYLQLVLEKSVEEFEYGKYSEEYALELKRELGNTKIAVLGSYINPSNPDVAALKDGMNNFKEKIRYASILKPLVVGTETGKYIDEKTHTEEAYEYLLENIREMVSEAEKFGVTIGIEGVHLFVINSPQMMARLINDVGSDNLKVIFDPCNLINVDNFAEQERIINDMFDLLGDKIAVLHVKDFVIENGTIKRTIPGEGMLDYDLIFRRLRPEVPVIVEEVEEDDALKAYANLNKFGVSNENKL